MRHVIRACSWWVDGCRFWDAREDEPEGVSWGRSQRVRGRRHAAGGRLQGARLQGGPVDGAEVRVLPDGRRPRGAAPQPLGGIHLRPPPDPLPCRDRSDQSDNGPHHVPAAELPLTAPKFEQAAIPNPTSWRTLGLHPCQNVIGLALHCQLHAACQWQQQQQ